MAGQTVFVETSIPSFYFERRSHALVQAWRNTTRQWWNEHRTGYNLVTSRFVIDELAKAPLAKREDALKLLADVPLLPDPPNLEAIIAAYVRNRLMPADALGDAAHLAFASFHGADFLLTWNCKHLANANKARHIETVNRRLDLRTPIITTPLTLLPED